MTTTKLDRSSENRIRSVRESAARFDTCTSSICTPPSMVKKIHGSAEGITHSIDEDEVNQFSSNINEVLGSDMHLSHLLPLALDGSSLFEACKDGLLLCKLLNSVAPLTIDDRVLNYHQPCMPLSLFHKTENINVAVQSAKSLGCSTVNIGPQDILEGRPHLILGLVSLQCHPELFRLLGEGEEIEDLLRLPPEKLLLRWVNYHLAETGCTRRASNLSTDLKDGEIYIRLLNRLSPDSMQLESTLREDIQARALAIVAAAACMGCKHYITPKAITTGNARLNMAFMASLFNKWPGLAPLDVEKQREVTILVEETQGDREARALVMWMNSLGVEPAVSNILWDLRDGSILLQALAKLYPGEPSLGSVAESKRISRFQMIENTNRVVSFCKGHVKLSMVGIQGADITDGSVTLTKALVWQLMRDHLLRTLRSTSPKIKDADMLAWANEKVVDQKISSFGDPLLKNGAFLISLLRALDPSIEPIKVLSYDSDEAELLNNARYILSVARRMGAALFLLPEDIVECKAKMIMTFVASLMALQRSI